MGDRNITLGAAGIAAVLLFIGVWSNSWWSGSMFGTDIKFGLREVSVCKMGQCVDAAYSTMGRRGGGSMFRMFGTMTFITGIVAAIGTIVAAFFHVFHGLDRYRSIAGPACLTMIPLSLITLLSFPGAGDLSIGWSLPVTLLGAAVGAYASFRAGGDSWNVGAYKPIRLGPQTDANGLAPTPQVDASGLAPIPNGDAVPGPSAAAADAPLLDLQPPVSRAAAGGGRAAPALRFMARRVEVTSVGISAMLVSGGQRDLLWDDIRRVSARGLAAASSHGGVVFIDVLPLPLLGRPSPPIRITSECKVDIDPGVADGDGDILRRIGNLAEENKAGIMEPASHTYFHVGAAPPMLTDDAALAEHDEQFTGGSYGR